MWRVRARAFSCRVHQPGLACSPSRSIMHRYRGDVAGSRGSACTVDHGNVVGLGCAGSGPGLGLISDCNMPSLPGVIDIVILAFTYLSLF